MTSRIRFMIAFCITTAVAASAAPTGICQERERLILLVASYSHPEKNLVAATLAWMAKANGVEFDAYYAADHGDGGMFSPHGSSLLAGRHEQALARVLAKYRTEVIRLGDTQVFGTLVRLGAEREISASSALEVYVKVCADFGWRFPSTAVAFQTRNLPKGLYEITSYLFPEVVYRQAVALPLEIDLDAIRRAKKMGVEEVFTVAAQGAPAGAWQAGGLSPKAADEFLPSDDLFSVTMRVARRWAAKARGVDILEPTLAAGWVPFSIREQRLQICSAPTIRQAVESLPGLLGNNADHVIYLRMGGGAVEAVGDIGLYPLYQRNYSVEVIEPGRPVLTILSKRPDALPQPLKSVFDLEPSDEQLRQWAREKKILATWVLHSGEMSHDDGIINFIEFSTERKIPIGMGVHWQRYAFEPWSIEASQLPQDQGGALGLVEPVLHSAGDGIVSERLADAKIISERMRQSRDRIAAVAGARFAPRGVYCFLDADPGNWDSPAPDLWRAIQSAGFEYVISSVASGDNRVLYRDGNFMVLNMVGLRDKYSSPFVSNRFHTDEMQRLEEALSNERKPGWLIGVLDIPIYGYLTYLPTGRSWGDWVRITEFYDYIQEGARQRNLIPATPHTIVRYARILQDTGLLAPQGGPP